MDASDDQTAGTGSFAVRRAPPGPTGGLIALVSFTLAIHVVVALTTAYGLHRDEFLYLAMGRHLDWGFLEVPPGLPAVAALLQSTFGTSLEAVRLVPGLGHAILVLLAGLLVRELEGRLFAILVAGLCALIAPVYLRAGTLFQPVIFDQLAWTAAALFVARRIRREEPTEWLWVGVACGVGLVFKYSILVFGVALLVGVLLTPLRRDLTTPWPWAGAGIAAACAVPNLLWQVGHDWPLIQHLRALSESQLSHVGALDFVVEQVLMLHPITLPIWGAGLYVLFTAQGRTFRVLGWTYLTCFVLLLVLQGKPYYLAPAYPMLLVAGAVAVERLVRRWRPRLLRVVILSVLLLSGVLLAPMGMPVLPPPAMARYVDAIGLAPESEIGQPMRLPQDYADMLGWREMVVSTAQVYHNLPGSGRNHVLIFGESYGHAGAIDYYGAPFGLPSAISASGSYYLWGPGDERADAAVFLGLPVSEVRPYFGRCTTEAVARHPWAREGAEPIVVCRDPTTSLSRLWPTLDPW